MRQPGSGASTSPNAASARPASGRGPVGRLAETTERSCLRRILVLKGQPQLGPEYDLAAVLNVQILLHHFGDAQVTQGLAGGVHRGDRGVLPGLGACADDVDDPVNAHGILLDSAKAAICSLS